MNYKSEEIEKKLKKRFIQCDARQNRLPILESGSAGVSSSEEGAGLPFVALALVTLAFGALGSGVLGSGASFFV